MAQLTVDQWLDIAKTVGTIIGLFGGGAILANIVNKNYNDKFDTERKERDRLEAARVKEMVLMHEGLTAVGNVAQVTAELYQEELGADEKLSAAVNELAKFKAKENEQMWHNAAVMLHCEGGR